MPKWWARAGSLPFLFIDPSYFAGEKCMYRHALPPGFVLKSEKKAMEEAAKANTISLEEFLEVEVRKCSSLSNTLL